MAVNYQRYSNIFMFMNVVTIYRKTPALADFPCIAEM